MAHQIESTDAFGEVRTGKVFGQDRGRAWHGLGKQLKEGLSVTEAFKELGLNWETELCPVQATFNGQTVNLPEHRAHIRLDTGGVLGVVSSSYKKISNQALAEFADALAGDDRAVTLETGGSLRHGKRVFCLIRLPHDSVIGSDDHLKNYVCVSNGHDGENAFRVFYTAIRVVCANTLAWAEEGQRGGVRFMHDGDMDKKLEMARAVLGTMATRSKSFSEIANRMANVKLTNKKRTDYFNSVYAATFGPIRESKDDEGVSLRHHQSTTGMWLSNMDRKDNMVKSTEGSLWQALNAVTYYHDHQRGRMKDVSESDGRVHSNLFGVSASEKTTAYREALALL